MIFSVSEANNFIKALLDAVPQLQTIFVRGEISNYKLYPSGHHYFTLKDEGSALKCVMFRGMAGKLRFRPENGMKVIAFGRIGVFPRDGAYQLYCSELSVEGVGDLHVAFEQLKEKLFKEGLFAPEHKKPLPKYPKRIAIITSSAGAAVHDMLRILNARWPMSEIVLLPVRVQGAEAPPEIAGALRLRMIEERVGRAFFHDGTVGDKDHAIGNAARKVHLVRHYHHGHALACQADHHLEHFVDHLGVKSAGGLVKEHGTRVHGKGAGDGYALLLTARDLGGHFLGLFGHAHALEQAHGAVARLFARETQHVGGGEHHVFQHGHV